MEYFDPRGNPEAIRAMLSLPIHNHVSNISKFEWILVGCMVQVERNGAWMYGFVDDQTHNITAYCYETNTRRKLTVDETAKYKQAKL